MMTICSLGQCEPKDEEVTEILTVKTTGQSVFITDEILARPPSVSTSGIMAQWERGGNEIKEVERMRGHAIIAGGHISRHVEGQTRTFSTLEN